MIRSALRYDLMGIIPHEESPWGWAPTIRFGMAADAINVSETTYLTAVLYYLVNLGTTLESQVRSSVAPPCRRLSTVVNFSNRLFLSSPFSSHLAVCRAFLSTPLRKDS